MRRIACLVAAFCVASPVSAQSDAEAPTRTAQALPPGVARAVENLRAKGGPPGTTLFYMELHDHGPDGQPVMRFDMVLAPEGLDRLLAHPREETEEFFVAVAPDFQANSQWRSLLVIVAPEEVMVTPGGNPAPYEGFRERMRALAERAFPGHS